MGYGLVKVGNNSKNKVGCLNEDFQGDWEKYHKESKDLYVIEPVIESLLQLLVQSILLYVVLGPGESNTSASEDDTRISRLVVWGGQGRKYPIFFRDTRCLLALSVIYLNILISELNWDCFKTVNFRCKTWCNWLDIYPPCPALIPPLIHFFYCPHCPSSSTWWLQPDRHLLDVVPVDDGEDSLRGSPRLLFLLCLPQLCQVGAVFKTEPFWCRSHSLDILVKGNKKLPFWYSQDSDLGPSARHTEFLLDDFSESCRANPHQGGPLSLKYCLKNHLDKYHYTRKSEKTTTTVFQIAIFRFWHMPIVSTWPWRAWCTTLSSSPRPVPTSWTSSTSSGVASVLKAQPPESFAGRPTLWPWPRPPWWFPSWSSSSSTCPTCSMCLSSTSARPPRAWGWSTMPSSSSSRSSPTCTSTSLQTGSKREDCRKECEGGPSRVPTYRHQPQATEEKGRLFSLCASKLNARE